MKIKHHGKLKWILSIIGILLIGSIIYGVWYLNDYYKASPEAISALESTETVVIEEKNDMILFTPTQHTGVEDTGFIFYPGAKVDYVAYVPFLKKIAEEGYFVALPKMTFNLAILSSDRADEVMALYSDKANWVIGGHSLGGSMASDYALKHQDRVEGVVFWASYPNKSLAQTTLKALCVYGSNDGFTTPEKIAEKKSLFPKDTTFTLIEGGNHSQFGDYGFQQGDGQATIDLIAQEAQVTNVTVLFLGTIK